MSTSLFRDGRGGVFAPKSHKEQGKILLHFLLDNDDLELELRVEANAGVPEVATTLGSGLKIVSLALGATRVMEQRAGPSLYFPVCLFFC